MKSGIGPETLAERLLRLGHAPDAKLTAYLREVQADGYDLLNLCMAAEKARRRANSLYRRGATWALASEEYTILSTAKRALAWMLDINLDEDVRYDMQAAV